MRDRNTLTDRFKKIIQNESVYFQPPSNCRMTYPAIVYRLDDIRTMFADNKTFMSCKKYLVTVITKDPDDSLITKLLDEFTMISFIRSYCKDGLNHYVYTLYY